MEFILNWIAKSAIGALLTPLLNAYLTSQKQKLDAAGSHEARTAEIAQKALEVDRREAELNAQVVIAEQGNWFTRSVRPLLGWPAAIITWKLLVWDLALGQWTQGHTDKLSDQALWLLTTIVVAYMGGRSAEKVAETVAGVFKRK